MDKKERIRDLIDQINELNYHYYTLDKPLISDGEYDKLYDELKNLEEETGIVDKFSPTQRVGGVILDKFEKHYHISRLYSQDKSQNYEDLKEWINRCERLRQNYNNTHEDKLKKLEFITEYKFDGLTINLTYNDGVLQTAATRGNGIVGENVLEQVLTISSIPTKIDEKSLIEVQAEAVMPLSSLKKYNEENEVPLKNARNAAAGAIRNLDTSQTKKRNLKAYFYQIPTNELSFETEEEMLKFLEKQKLPVYPYYNLIDNFDDLVKEIERIKVQRHKIDILTDGVVIKINDIKTQKVLGYTNKFPRWSIAFKYDPEEYTTILEDVLWNVGRTGKVTPSAIVKPVDFSGVTVRRATLNNYDDIERKKLRIGSKVFIRRSNDVIPEILGVVDENQKNTKKIEKPSRCPFCNSELIEGNVHIYCPNSISCTPQLKARLVHFASREAMDIDGLSERTAELFIKNLNINEIYDLYDIEYEDLIKLESFKEKKTNNLLNAIENSKECDLSNFTYAIGIPNVGVKTANDLANKFKTFNNLRNAKEDELIEIEDIGEKTASYIIDFFNDHNISKSIDILLSKGIKIKEIEKGIKSDLLKNKNIVITGSIDNYKRNDLKKLIENNLGNVTSSVSKNTDLVLCGQKPGSKRDKAIELGIEILESEDLLDFIEKLEENYE
ncbi:NAD-dependent DNA ligase LigA [Anaerococcus porci]|uniref:NAD-dependent DNA ligase LigA n=1 Tax=Anaerococcus porci TaxID=2652269 RepID=UPI002A7645CC|nr:NAD-dependent DNA ligase LigA [Anaerococcus porci]MDY3007342.1 NAD-dependent DNA ligase LigA [Anaerococcus porci]